jgi:hypothetical protein
MAKATKEEKIILITNDDGITSPGIKNLVEAAKGLGKVIVVAPDKPQSGMGHAITIGSPLRMNKVDLFEGVESWQTSGTPVDCVKLAVDKILVHELVALEYWYDTWFTTVTCPFVGDAGKAIISPVGLIHYLCQNKKFNF